MARTGASRVLVFLAVIGTTLLLTAWPVAAAMSEQAAGAQAEQSNQDQPKPAAMPSAPALPPAPPAAPSPAGARQIAQPRQIQPAISEPHTMRPIAGDGITPSHPHPQRTEGGTGFRRRPPASSGRPVGWGWGVIPGVVTPIWYLYMPAPPLPAAAPCDDATPSTLEQAAEDIGRAWEQEAIAHLARHLQPGARVRFFAGNEYSHSLTSEQVCEMTRQLWGQIHTRTYQLRVFRVLPGGDWGVLKGTHVYQDTSTGEITTVYVRYLLYRDAAGAWIIKEISLSDQPL